MTPSYAEMVAATNFSLLCGAAHPREMVLAAVALGHAGLGIADLNSVAGVVRAHTALNEIRKAGVPSERVKQGDSPDDEMVLKPMVPPVDAGLAALGVQAQGFRLAVGARLAFLDTSHEIVVYCRDRAGWGRLCRLLTTGNRRAPKGECHLTLADLTTDIAGLLLVAMPARRTEELLTLLRSLAAAAPGAVWLGATMPRRGDDRRRLAGLQEIAAAAGVPLLATNDALYAYAGQRVLQDVLTCVREGVTLAAAGCRLELNAERHLKPPAEMARLFADAPDAIVETGRLLAAARFSLDDLRYEYPDEPIPPGWEPQAWLIELTERALPSRYPMGVPPKVRGLIDDELKLIAELGYARYFLTIHDIVAFANTRGILCQGRGSAANSAVCYVLGITAVDPAEHDLLFARFISTERQEPPDIDVDFEHERREEVIQYIYAKYGRHRAGIVGTVISYRPRSAVRDVGKVMGLTADVTDRLASTQWGSWGREISDPHLVQAGVDPANPVIRQVVDLSLRLMGFPRHLSQHVGGFVLARERLDDIVPIGNAAMPNRTYIEWDKDDIDALGLMKVDVLALGMLTCIRKAFALLAAHEGILLGLADVPPDDPLVYDMLCRGDSLGVFQVESRAQMNMLPRLRPRRFYDLIIQVAIVRPGPIQGDMVHPYLRRRAKLEPADYPSPAAPYDPNELRHVLEKTLGVPLFQEQAMKLAMVAAEFTDVEANQLRRAMATFKQTGGVGEFEELMIKRMVARGYERSFAERCFGQIKGFGSYGFPESHAASFAKLVYVSSWIKCHHPAVFAAALLNSQPMGFYAPSQIVRDAQAHGVAVLPVDVNHSNWDNTLERDDDGALTLRLGLRQIDGLAQADMRRLVCGRLAEPYGTVDTLATRSGLHGRALRLLADADAFGSLGLGRRDAMWAVRRLPDAPEMPLWAAAAARELAAEPEVPLPPMRLAEHVVADYQTTGLSLKGHPMGLLRAGFAKKGALSAVELEQRSDGAWVTVAGVVLVRQRPGNGKAIFLTLEDETGIVNIIQWASGFERVRGAIMAGRLLEVRGQLQRSPEGVSHVIAHDVINRSADLKRISDIHQAEPALSRADEFARPQPARSGHPRDTRILSRSRDFH